LLILPVVRAIEIRPATYIKLTAYDAYIGFASTLYADRIEVYANLLRFYGARMGTGLNMTGFLSLRGGNLTVNQFYLNARLNLTLNLTTTGIIMLCYNLTPNFNVYDSAYSLAIPVVEIRNWTVKVARDGYAASFNTTTYNLTLTIPATGLHVITLSPSLPDGSACEYGSDCTGGYCVHEICRSTPTYCGDRYCDVALGEDWWSCWADCFFRYVPPKIEVPEIEVITTIGQVNITIPNMAANETVDIPIERVEGLATRKISLTAINYLSNVKLYIRRLDKLPTEIARLEDVVYHLFNIDKVNVEDKDVEKVVIGFEVSRQWIDDNRINVTTVVLERWNGTDWLRLPTTQVDEDEDYVFFEAKSDTLSIFAITAQPIPVPVKECPPCPPCSEWSVCIEGQQTRICWECGIATNYTCQKYTESRACEVPLPIPWLFIVILLVVTLTLLIIYFYRRTKYDEWTRLYEKWKRSH